MSSLIGKFYYFKPKFIEELGKKEKSSNFLNLK
jgi:hypothetical protein